MTKDWDSRVDACLEARFRDAPIARGKCAALWASHRDSGFADAHFVSEFTGQSYATFRQRLWEMLLGRHLQACGHRVSTRPKGGPDYRLEIGDTTVWVEAVSPTPGPDLPREWTTFDPSHDQLTCVRFPHQEMLLRWTSAFEAKAIKYRSYLEGHLVGPADSFVIAIDGSQLCSFPQSHGISQRPFIVEAVFAVGPLAVEVERDTGRFGETVQTTEILIRNRNESPVYKEPFFRIEYSGISAVFGCCPNDHSDAVLPLHIAYNPLAHAPIDFGRFGTAGEQWVAGRLSSHDPCAEEWRLQRFVP